jgi:hypothetical protein
MPDSVFNRVSESVRCLPYLRTFSTYNSHMQSHPRPLFFALALCVHCCQVAVGIHSFFSCPYFLRQTSRDTFFIHLLVGNTIGSIRSCPLILLFAFLSCRCKPLFSRSAQQRSHFLFLTNNTGQITASFSQFDHVASGIQKETQGLDEQA